MRVLLRIVVNNVLVEAEEDAQLGNHVVCNELFLGLMSISAVEILYKLVLLVVDLKIALEKGESQKVRIGQIVKNRVS